MILTGLEWSATSRVSHKCLAGDKVFVQRGSALEVGVPA